MKIKYIGVQPKRVRDWEQLFNSIDSGLPATVSDPERIRDSITALKAQVQMAREELEEVAQENERERKTQYKN